MIHFVAWGAAWTVRPSVVELNPVTLDRAQRKALHKAVEMEFSTDTLSGLPPAMAVGALWLMDDLGGWGTRTTRDQYAVTCPPTLAEAAFASIREATERYVAEEPDDLDAAREWAEVEAVMDAVADAVRGSSQTPSAVNGEGDD